MTEIKKYSEILKEEAQNEDNEFQLVNLATKILREERLEKFEEQWVGKIISSPKIIKFNLTKNGGYTFWLDDGKIVDFYPKANNLLDRKNKEWIKPGLRWLIKTLELTKRSSK